MGEAVAFVVFMLIAIFVFEAALGFTLALLIYGPGAYAAIVAGWYAAHLGAELPWAITIGLAIGVLVRACTISLVQFLAGKTTAVLSRRWLV